MDLTQRKLTKAEWEGIEVPVNPQEQEILNLMKRGFHDVMIKYNKTESILSHSKITQNDAIHNYMYEKYFQKIVEKMCKTHGLDFKIQKSKQATLKKADQIRMENVESGIKGNKMEIYEFIILFHVLETA